MIHFSSFKPNRNCRKNQVLLLKIASERLTRALRVDIDTKLSSYLKCANGRRLKAQIGLEVLRDLADEALERQLADEQLGRLLVPADLTQRDGARAVAVRLLHAAGRWRRILRGLGRVLREVMASEAGGGVRVSPCG